MGTFEDLECVTMTIPEFRQQVEKWVAAGEISEDDVDFIIATEEAWREIEDGDCVTMTEAEFRKELTTW